MNPTEHPSRATPAIRMRNDARRAGTRTGGVARRASRCLAAALLFGVTAASSAGESGDYFAIRSSPGQVKPAPESRFEFDGNRVSYYSHGLDLDLFPEAKYAGIGKYTGKLSDRYRPELEQVKRMLASHEIASVRGRNIGSVLTYSVEQNGTRYQGALQYRSSDEITVKLQFLYEIAQDLLDHGTPEINLHPAFTAHSASGNLVVDMVFGNDGTEEVVIDGPEKWLPKRVYLNAQYAEISAINDAGIGFKVSLVEKYLSPASRPYASSISIKPGQPVKVEFVVPYDELTFDPGSSAQQIQGGTFRMYGVANVNIQSPSVMKGAAFIRMDKQPAVDLTER
ncbi:hypothetical protein BLA9940_02869 [Burkholderia aenigmatica]|uniref:Uncharacterized protein n=1 Tax=Burkholderia aenigmatica TaxID=2015348 RepID=A0A6J5IV40_9BURK|nr:MULTISPECIES: hypothetical protein [Burkholderia]CAB3963605.1 hypothetical protein BLA3211_02387 [Burkholderia aenigmatica]VWC59260.1 hypothetical protein BLA9940_02869 [Burkholderia aenigmatica]